MKKGLQVRAISEGIHGRGIALFVEEFDGTNFYTADPLIMQKREYEFYKPSLPTCNISVTSAQQLIDDLWQAGLRPSEGTGSAGQLAATQKHLEDMRSLTFSKLNVEKP